MTVNELIERLQECDPDAEVRIMMQESWPFENAIDGVAVREGFAQEECECDHRIDEPHEQGCTAEDEEFEDGLQGNDVFIVEGRQERYGNKNAWPAAIRERRGGSTAQMLGELCLQAIAFPCIVRAPPSLPAWRGKEGPEGVERCTAHRND